jgi:hypothetical protein
MGEVRAIDDDQRIGPRRNHRGGGLPDAAQDGRQFRRDRRHPDDRQLGDVERRHDPLRRHRAPADPAEPHVRIEPQQRAHQRAAERVARLLGGDQVQGERPRQRP